MAHLDLNSLTELEISYPSGSPNNQAFDHGAVSDPQSPPTDLLCRAINRLCQLSPLRKLHLCPQFILSPDLFSTASMEGQQNALWPHMETVYIDQASALTANGGWLIKGDGNEGPPPKSRGSYLRPLHNGEKPVHRFRTRFDPETFNPLLKNMIQGIVEMPKLKRMWVSFETPHLPTVEYHLETPFNCTGDIRFVSSRDEALNNASLDTSMQALLEGHPSLQVHHYPPGNLSSWRMSGDVHCHLSCWRDYLLKWKVQDDFITDCQNWMASKNGIFRDFLHAPCYGHMHRKFGNIDE